VASLPDVQPALKSQTEANAALKTGTDDTEIEAQPPSNRQGFAKASVPKDKKATATINDKEVYNGGRYWTRTSDPQLVEHNR